MKFLDVEGIMWIPLGEFKDQTIKPTVYFGEPVLDKDTLVHWVRMIHQR